MGGLRAEGRRRQGRELETKFRGFRGRETVSPGRSAKFRVANERPAVKSPTSWACTGRVNAPHLPLHWCQQPSFEGSGKWKHVGQKTVRNAPSLYVVCHCSFVSSTPQRGCSVVKL